MITGAALLLLSLAIPPSRPSYATRAATEAIQAAERRIRVVHIDSDNERALYLSLVRADIYLARRGLRAFEHHAISEMELLRLVHQLERDVEDIPEGSR